MPPFNYRAPSGGGAAPNLGWRRLLLGDATFTDDPHTQSTVSSITEDADKTTWTSAAAVTIDAAGVEDIPNHGAIYGQALTDANGDAVTWDKPFYIHFLIETVEASRVDLKDSQIYYGLGLTDSTTALDDTNNSIGYATSWVGTGSNYQRQTMFLRDTWNTATHSPDWDVYGVFVHGPRRDNQAGHMQVSRYKYDPGNHTGTGDTGLSFRSHGSNRIAGMGPVYIFATCGVHDDITSAVEADFRLWYSVTGNAWWVAP